MIWIIRILIIAACSWLNYKGGKNWLPARRFIMPALIGTFWAIQTHWWIFFAIGMPMGFLLSTGDGNRPLWCALGALGASIALMVTGSVAWWLGVPYIVLNAFIGWKVVSWKSCDYFTGAGFASLVFLV